MRKIVITGCSGGGKSSLLKALSDQGHVVVEEPGRRVIAVERASGGRGTPWQDPVRFAELAFQMALEDHAKATAPLTFFDRSALDQAAWFAREGLTPPSRVPTYDKTVFFAPPWPEIYAPDSERRHTLEAALVEADDLVTRLPAWGYRLVALPKSGVADRVQFVLSQTLREAA